MAATTLFAVAEGGVATEPGRGLGIAGSVLGGLLLVAAFFGGLAAWSAYAPLESAAMAPGTVDVDGRRKTVQHLEGGIVSEILVREGDVVTAGQPLVRLDQTQTRATLARLHNQSAAAAALIARLEAERDSTDAIAFPGWLATDADPDVTQTITGQQRIFDSHRDNLANQTAILRQRQAQLQEQIAGLNAEIAAQDRQLSLIADEVTTVSGLLDRGLEQRPRLLDLQRQQAQIEGQKAHNQGAIAEAGQAIGEAALQIDAGKAELVNTAVEKLRDAETDYSDLAERIVIAEDTLARATIAAPVAGTVVNLQLFTPGGVIERGQPLLDIVPSDQPFTINARIDLNDIDIVHQGLTAEIRLTALNQRTTPILKGTVVQISADRLVDAHTGQGYYAAQIQLDPDQMADAGIRLYPGMPVEAMISTGEQTLLDYLLKPIVSSMSRGMRES